MSEQSMARKTAHYVIILMAICLVSGAGVGILYKVGEEDIRKNERRVFDASLAVVLGEYDEIEPLGEYAEGTPQEQKVFEARIGPKVRYAATGQAQGYQSVIKVIVSIESDRPKSPLEADPAIFRMAVVSSNETPGLGENIRKVEKDISLWAAIAGKKPDSEPKRPAFQEQFSGMRLSDLPRTQEDGLGNVTPVTGATITSTAAALATRNAVEKILLKTRQVYGGRP